MKLKPIFSAMAATMLFSACSTENIQLQETDVTQITTAETTTYFTEVSQETTSALESEISPSETVSEPVAGEIVVAKSAVYDFPDEFYQKFAELVDSYDHFLYYDISMAYYDIETGFSLIINPDKHYYQA